MTESFTLDLYAASGHCRIYTGTGLSEAFTLIEEKGASDAVPVFVITDQNLNRHYAPFVYRGKRLPVFVMAAGEASKNLDTAAGIMRWLMQHRAGRDAFLMGVGGGVVCDMTGFVASVYKRGLRFGLAATSLMAQTDAAIGGKNGVNLDGYKNMVGLIRQPAFVACCTPCLSTLPGDEFRQGMAEIIKHALIGSPALFDFLEKNTEHIFRSYKTDTSFINTLLRDSIMLKLEVVSRDEQERGERRKLNLGHSWGHAVETVFHLAHGDAVATGMVFASGLSRRLGSLNSEDEKRLIRLLERTGLPASLPGRHEECLQVMLQDKKAEGDHIHFVLNRGIGQVSLQKLPIALIHDYVNGLKAQSAAAS